MILKSVLCHLKEREESVSDCLLLLLHDLTMSDIRPTTYRPSKEFIQKLKSKRNAAKSKSK